MLGIEISGKIIKKGDNNKPPIISIEFQSKIAIM